MKKFFSWLLMGGALFLTSCEVTREISIKPDGSGVMVTTTDLSSVIGMAKMAGQGKELDKMEDKSIDTTIALASIADSIPDLTADERSLIKKGTLGFNMNMADEKFITKVELPFSGVDQIATLDKLTGKAFKEAMKKQMDNEKGEGEAEENAQAPGADDIPEGSIEDYFVTTYSKGLISKTLNKEKYATVDQDEAMQALKQMSSMGAGTTTLVFNLPNAVKKAEGKNVKVSDDKKKVTITSSTEDFFSDASALEFRIEY